MQSEGSILRSCSGIRTQILLVRERLDDMIFKEFRLTEEEQDEVVLCGLRTGPAETCEGKAGAIFDCDQIVLAAISHLLSSSWCISCSRVFRAPG
ncbi:MAG: hypothetical protein PHQ81_04915 [Methanofollis sp.]|nr:hypothetical protein [Methanofollis sp.]